MGKDAQGISNSEFAMWRAVFAFSLVDNILSIEEQNLLNSYYTHIPFSSIQSAILKEDFKFPQDVSTLFRGITNPKDKERFCVLARALVWCEGNMDEQECIILKHVGCLRTEEENAHIFSHSREHPDLKNYHQYYAKAGIMGFLKKTSQYMQIQI